jgi:hypothetical protein
MSRVPSPGSRRNNRMARACADPRIGNLRTCVSQDDLMAHRMLHASLKKLSDPPSQNRCRPSTSGLSRPDAKRHEIDIPRRFDRVPDRRIRVGGRGADLYGASSRLDEGSVLRWHLPCQCDAVISLTPGPGTAASGHAICEPHCWRVPDLRPSRYAPGASA